MLKLFKGGNINTFLAHWPPLQFFDRIFTLLIHFQFVLQYSLTRDVIFAGFLQCAIFIFTSIAGV